MGEYGHIDKEYLNEVEKLKGKSPNRTFPKKIILFRLLFLISTILSALGLISIFIAPSKYIQIIGIITGVGLLVACGIMLLYGGPLPLFLRKELDDYWNMRRPTLWDKIGKDN